MNVGVVVFTLDIAQKLRLSQLGRLERLMGHLQVVEATEAEQGEDPDLPLRTVRPDVQLLDAERVPVLNPALGRGAHPGIGTLGRAVAAGDGRPAQAEVRKINLQDVRFLVCIGGVQVLKAAVQHNLVLTLVVLEGDDTGSEVISCTLYHG